MEKSHILSLQELALTFTLPDMLEGFVALTARIIPIFPHTLELVTQLVLRIFFRGPR